MKATEICMILLIQFIFISCSNDQRSNLNSKTRQVKDTTNLVRVDAMAVPLKDNPVQDKSVKADINQANGAIETEKMLPPASLPSAADEFQKKPFQEIRIPADRDTLISLAEGTTIRIPAHSFVYVSDGKLAKGPVTVLAKEFYRNSDIIMAGISTRTEKDILETGGMIYLEARSGLGNCGLAPDKTIEVGFPGNKKDKNMQLFNGYPDANNKIIWKLASENAPTADAPSEIFTVVEEQPEFPGGDNACVNFLKENIRYPEEAIQTGIEGRVFVSFVVEENGSLTNIRILRGIGGGCDDEAIRVIKAMPKWIPGRQSGKPVKVQFNLPVRFSLDKVLPALNDGNRSVTRRRNDSASENRGFNQEIRYNDTYSIVFRSGRLGWLNCDKIAYFSNPRINVSLECKNAAEIDMVMVFQRIRVILCPSYINKDKIVFEGIPKNEKVTLVSIHKKDGKRFLSVKEIITGESLQMDENFREVTPEELYRELRKLDR